LANAWLPEINHRSGRPSADSSAEECEIERRYSAILEPFRSGPLRLLLRLPRFPGVHRPGTAASSTCEIHETIRWSLTEIAGAAEQSPNEGTSVELHDPVPSSTLAKISRSGRIHLKFDGQDFVSRIWRDFLWSLSGCEAKRIRICPICENLFWAAREDRHACPGRCNNIRRQQVFRLLHENSNLPERAEIARKRAARRQTKNIAKE
jgi:hypothetical protein